MPDSLDEEATNGSPGTIEDKDSRGIKRNHQACNNCRRKKVRCSGTRPTCNFCLRLSQKCQYTDAYVIQNSRSEIESSSDNSLLMRIELLEAQLNQYQSQPSANDNTIGVDLMQDSTFHERLSEIKVDEMRAAAARARRLQEEEDDRTRRRLEEEEDRRRRIAQENEERARREALEIEEHNRKLRQLVLAEAQVRRDSAMQNSENSAFSEPRALDQMDQNARIQTQGSVPDFSFQSFFGPESTNDKFAAMQVSADLPPPDLLQESVNCYFRLCYNQPYSLFHEDSFKRRLTSGLIPDYVLFLLVVFGLRFCEKIQAHDYFAGRASEFSILYTKTSWKQILQHWNEMDEETDLVMAQAISLHSILDFTEGRIHKAWIKIGVAVRVCQDLQLMLEPDVQLPIAEQEERRRVFWSIYMQDKFASCGKGRVSAIRDEDCKVQLPCDERSFKLGISVYTSRLDQLINRDGSISGSPSPFALAVFMASTLGQCARYSLHEYKLVSQLPPWDATSMYTSITSTLLYFESSFHMKDPLSIVLAKEYTINGILDQQASSHLIITHVIFNLCQCLLNHPLALHQAASGNPRAPKGFIRRALDVSREHAISLSSLLHDADTAGCSVSSPICGYSSMVAGTIHALNTHSEVESIRREAVKYLDFSLSCLSNLSRFWKNAGLMLQWLQNFREHSARYSLVLQVPSSAVGVTELEMDIIWGCIDYNFVSRPSSLSQLPKPVPTASTSPKDLLQSVQASDPWSLDDPFAISMTGAIQPYNLDFVGVEHMQDLEFDVADVPGALLNDGQVGGVNNNEFSVSANEPGIQTSQTSDHESPLFRFLISQSKE